MWENASSPPKLQPPIYYVYVYKSLRRPHIPEARKDSDRGEEAWKEEEQESGDWSEDVWRVVRMASCSQCSVLLWNDDHTESSKTYFVACVDMKTQHKKAGWLSHNVP